MLRTLSSALWPNLSMLSLLLTFGMLSGSAIEPASQAPVSPVQAAPSAQTSTGTEVEDPHYEQFLETLRFYENALEGYDFDVKQLRKRKAPKEDYPIPPEYTYYDAFKDLAEKGSVWSMAWLVENLSVRHREEEELIRETRAWHHRMFEEGKNSNAILRPVERLPLAWKSLGVDFILEEMSALFERSTHPGVRGNALYAQGRTLVLSAEEKGDPQIRADADTLYAQLLDSFPESPLAPNAAMAIFPSVMERFNGACKEWIAKVEELSQLGTPYTEWPERPGREFESRYKTLVAGQMLQASHWYYQYWLASQMEYEEQGLARGLCGDALRIGSLATVSRQPYLERMFEFFVPLTREFQSEPWFDAWLEAASIQMIRRRIAPDVVVPGVEKWLEVVTVPEFRHRLNYLLADACLRMNPRPNLERAEDLFRNVHEALDGHEAPGLAKLGDQAATLVEHIQKVRVGADASWFSGSTPYGETLRISDYAGKVLLLDFFAFTSSGTKINAPKLQGLRERYAEKGFEVIGLCSDGFERKLFRNNAQEAGIAWPCISSFRTRGSLWSDWFVIGYPKYFVIGADGRIVGRDLNFEAAEALVQRELEAGTKTDD